MSRPNLTNDVLGSAVKAAVADIRHSRMTNDVYQALDTRLGEIGKAMRENRTIAAYELIRQLQEFVSYERAKQSAQ